MFVNDLLQVNYCRMGVLIEDSQYLLDCPLPKFVFVFLIVYNFELSKFSVEEALT